ncbi:MAG: hypothetical protein O6940_03090 [Ignavibacteria bacterium]|nr:hypothetical protein [Ignavibacteria bacterium]
MCNNRTKRKYSTGKRGKKYRKSKKTNKWQFGVDVERKKKGEKKLFPF